MNNNFEWIAVQDFSQKTIGAVGFIGNNAVSVVAFFDDTDGNKDGKISTGEWLGSKVFDLSGKAVTEVAMRARWYPSIITRDFGFDQMAKKMYFNFAGGLVAQGIYKVYFGRGVKLIGGGIAKKITSSMVKQIVIRKGFEKAAKKAFMSAVNP